MAIRIALLLWLCVCCFANIDNPDIIAEEQGYLTREHSLGRPFQGRGTEVGIFITITIKSSYIMECLPFFFVKVPYWEFSGSTVLTNDYIRLTPDRQSKKGSLWNTVVSNVSYE